MAFVLTRIFICEDSDPLRPCYKEAPSAGDIFKCMTCQKPGKGNRFFGFKRKQRRRDESASRHQPTRDQEL